MIPFSVLDLSPICAGHTPADALRNSLDLARNAERLGYRRYWLAEHHNMTGIASAATSVVIGHVAAGTSTIRVGSGGIMLPNHAPLVIAEQFGTLEALFPGRIDLGLGRAPGTDMRTARALRRNDALTADQFPDDVIELQDLLGPAHPGQAVRAVPGTGSEVPIWLLGSSLFSAQLAAHLGMPFSFASHFAPDLLMQALHLYRSNYRPSLRWPRPYAMPGVNVTAADTDEEAQRLFTSVQQAFVNLRRGTPGPLPAPVDDIHAVSPPDVLANANHALSAAVVGGPATLRDGLARFIEQTQADELIITGQIHSHAARVHSFELIAEARAALGGAG